MAWHAYFSAATETFHSNSKPNADVGGNEGFFTWSGMVVDILEHIR